MRVAVLMPSRGVISSKVLEAVYGELRDIEHKIFYSHDLSIPLSFNDLTDRALKWDADILWYVEEDTEPPQGSLNIMLELNFDIVAVAYPLKCQPIKMSYCMVGEQVAWTSFGCTIIKKHVFDKLNRPFFQDGYDMQMIHAGSGSNWKYAGLKKQEAKKYGCQDVYLCAKAWEQGLKIGVVSDVVARHHTLNYKEMVR